MRYLVGMMCVLAGLVALPLSASAQTGEEGTISEPNLQELAPSFEPDPEDLKDSVPSSEPASEEPALQLKLDSAGVEVVPSPPRTIDGYTLKEMELRVRRAGIGLGVSGGVLLAGVVMGAIALSEAAPFFCIIEACPPTAEWAAPVGWTGALLTLGGLVGMIATGKNLSRRKRKLRELQEARYGRPHRVQWDLAQSRLVF
jgi:hypothetical protein